MKKNPTKQCHLTRNYMAHFQDDYYQTLLAEILEIKTALAKGELSPKYKSYLEQANRLKELKREANKIYISSRGL